MKIVTAAEMREIDRQTSDRFGVPSLTLMENAGGAVADFVASAYPHSQRITVVCGKGNNGGDGGRIQTRHRRTKAGAEDGIEEDVTLEMRLEVVDGACRNGLHRELAEHFGRIAA